ncbi:Protein of unknown function DUF506 [Macleaya cordata]|uniref:Uncharacterized protein n=1 Tax=Macleaya cordata TaxID=56857 RepID=A0A200QDS2_MACCD|nr:Protein of unknown function DUF506 [Macleaya cordata]
MQLCASAMHGVCKWLICKYYATVCKDAISNLMNRNKEDEDEIAINLQLIFIFFVVIHLHVLIKPPLKLELIFIFFVPIHLHGILGNVKDAEMVVLEKVVKFLRNLTSKGMTDNSLIKKRLVMMLKMEGYDVSLCRTSWITTLNYPGGDYEYIDIMMEDDDDQKGGCSSESRLIIDIDLKSHFELARPTSTYTELLNSLPTLFVGSEEKLKKIISLLCSAAKHSLKQNGLFIPPWRTINYMQSKWLSHCQKVPVITHPLNKSSRETSESKCDCDHQKNSSSKCNSSKWAPPIVKQKRSGLGGGSGLTSQFSKMSINCC